MTNEEYIQMITDSDVYKNLDATLQETIIKAEGNDKLRYEQIFLTERNGILAAKKDLIERNGMVIRGMELEMKTVRRGLFAEQ